MSNCKWFIFVKYFAELHQLRAIIRAHAGAIIRALDQDHLNRPVGDIELDRIIQIVKVWNYSNFCEDI